MSHVGSIAMGTAVAAVLSYAAWDTVHDGSGPPTCAQQHPEIAMIEDLRHAKQRKLSELAGPTLASPGEYLRGVTLETPLDPAIADRLPTITRPTPETPYQVTFIEEAGIVRQVEVIVGRYDDSYDEDCTASDDPCACELAGDDRLVCQDVERRLLATWGAPAIIDGDARVWRDAATGARATLARCVLTFDHAP